MIVELFLDMFGRFKKVFLFCVNMVKFFLLVGNKYLGSLRWFGGRGIFFFGWFYIFYFIVCLREIIEGL